MYICILPSNSFPGGSDSEPLYRNIYSICEYARYSYMTVYTLYKISYIL